VGVGVEVGATETVCAGVTLGVGFTASASSVLHATTKTTTIKCPLLIAASMPHVPRLGV
jgi:hypothetical protein